MHILKVASFCVAASHVILLFRNIRRIKGPLYEKKAVADKDRPVCPTRKGKMEDVDAEALLMPCDAELAIDIVRSPFFFFFKSFIMEGLDNGSGQRHWPLTSDKLKIESVSSAYYII